MANEFLNLQVLDSHKDLAKKIELLGEKFNEFGLTVDKIDTKLADNDLYASLSEEERLAFAQFIITFCDVSRKKKATSFEKYDNHPFRHTQYDPDNLMYVNAGRSITSYLITLAEYALLKQSAHSQDTTRQDLFSEWLTNTFEGQEPLLDLLMIKIIFDLKEPWELE